MHYFVDTGRTKLNVSRLVQIPRCICARLRLRRHAHVQRFLVLPLDEIDNATSRLIHPRDGFPSHSLNSPRLRCPVGGVQPNDSGQECLEIVTKTEVLSMIVPFLFEWSARPGTKSNHMGLLTMLQDPTHGSRHYTVLVRHNTTRGPKAAFPIRLRLR